MNSAARKQEARRAFWRRCRDQLLVILALLIGGAALVAADRAGAWYRANFGYLYETMEVRP